MDCRKALIETNADMEAAIDLLRAKGAASAAKKASRDAKEGVIAQAIGEGAKSGVLVEVNCETDFVAKMPEFRDLAHEIALQVASTAPLYVKKEDVPEGVIAEQVAKFKEDAVKEGKKPEIAERIALGRMDKFYQDNCLLEQVFVKDDKLKINDLLKNAIAKIGENIVVRRFARYQLGETTQAE